MTKHAFTMWGTDIVSKGHSINEDIEYNEHYCKADSVSNGHCIIWTLNTIDIVSMQTLNITEIVSNETLYNADIL